jgi:hypothetical protein
MDGQGTVGGTEGGTPAGQWLTGGVAPALGSSCHAAADEPHFEPPLWAESAPTRLASGRTGVPAEAGVPKRGAGFEPARGVPLRNRDGGLGPVFS